MAAHNNKSFWAVAVLFELALLDGNKRKVDELIPHLVELDGGREVEHLLEHLDLWNRMEHTERPAILGDIISELEVRKREGVKQRTRVTPIKKMIINLGLFFRAMVLPNNLKFGGVVPDAIASVADKMVTRLIVGHRLQQGDFIPQGGSLGQSLGDITDVEIANQWIDSYIEWLFGLKSDNGRRMLEILDSPEHQKQLDLFFREYRKFSGMEAFDRGSDFTTGADNVVMMAIAGKGDCRPTSYFKNILFDAWNRSRRDPLRFRALDTFEKALKDADQERENPFGQYHAAMQDFLKIRDHQFGVMQVFIFTDIQGKQMYDIPLHKEVASGKGLPISGCGLSVYNGRVLIDARNPDFKEYHHLQEVRDEKGQLIGYEHPFLIIGRDTEDNEFLRRDIRDPIISKYIVNEEGKSKVINQDLKPLYDTKGELVAINDTRLMLVHDSRGQARVLRIVEDHVLTVEIKYGKNEEVKGVKFRDTWYTGSGFYRYNNREIPVEELRDLFTKGEIHIPNAIETYNPITGDVESQEIVMRVSPYSDSTRILVPHRYSPGDLQRAAQPVFNVLNHRTQHDIMLILFRPEVRLQFDREISVPITSGTIGQENLGHMEGNSLPDGAMNTTRAKKGGIDFTAHRTPLEVWHSGRGIKFHLDPAMLKRLQDAAGVVPIVTNIRPMTDLQIFLGLKKIEYAAIH